MEEELKNYGKEKKERKKVFIQRSQDTALQLDMQNDVSMKSDESSQQSVNYWRGA